MIWLLMPTSPYYDGEEEGLDIRYSRSWWYTDLPHYKKVNKLWRIEISNVLLSRLSDIDKLKISVQHTLSPSLWVQPIPAYQGTKASGFVTLHMPPVGFVGRARPSIKSLIAEYLSYSFFVLLMNVVTVKCQTCTS